MEQVKRKGSRGFGMISPEKRREFAARGGHVAHQKNPVKCHEFKKGEQAAKDAGQKGGLASRGGRGKITEPTQPEGEWNHKLEGF